MLGKGFSSFLVRLLYFISIVYFSVVTRKVVMAVLMFLSVSWCGVVCGPLCNFSIPIFSL